MQMVSYEAMQETLQQLFARGYAALDATHVAEARAVFIAAVRRAAEEANRPALAEALCGLGRAEHGIGSLEAARHHYANAVLLYRQDGPVERLADTLRQEAAILREACLPAEAEPLYAEAETIDGKPR